ncbi:MAG: DUF4082 domain-containing protein [Bryobacteraceae bacterium]
MAQTSFWTTSATPQAAAASDSGSVTLGLKFSSDTAGFVSGLRFYKSSQNTGTHIGTLWSGSGAALATVTFSGETASGWQQANFSAPVSVAANTTYVISYFAPAGHYASDAPYSWSALSASPLHVSGSSPGVYTYGASSAYPTSSWNGSNYWVDVLFTTSAPVGISGSITNGAGSIVKLSGATTATTTADPTGKYSFSGVVSGSNTVTPTKSGLTFTPSTRTLTVGTANVTGVDFTASAANSLWTSTSTPVTAQETSDTASVTLGVGFYSELAGNVTAVRFYKGPANGGTHVGVLWDSNGTKLASVTFTGESASGWQQANFASPVSIAAYANYVISYLAPQGAYASDQAYQWSTVSASPLHVANLSPGVFAYGANATFPTGTWNSSNYWVDLVFVPGAPSSSPAGGSYSIGGTVTGSGATLTLSGGGSTLTTTTGGGSYTFGGLVNGSYVVTPSQAGYTFTPASATVTVNGSSINNVNFAATAASTAHSVSLSWTASTSSNITGYNVYRGTTSGGTYTKVNSAMVGTTTYVDGSVTAGQTYYYVTTAVDGSGAESGYSNQATAVVPTP